MIKRAGTSRATSSIIRSGEKDTEASIVQILSTILNFFKAGGKNEIWHKHASRYGEVKLIGSHAKIDVKAIPGDLCFLAP